MIDTHTQEWLEYGKWNQRDLKMAEIWVDKLSSFILSKVDSLPSKNILDYGCSHFCLGFALQNHLRSIDGFDIDRAVIESTRLKLERASASRLFSSTEDIPKKKYDFVILSSVFQYFKDHDEAEKVLLTIREQYLKDENSEIWLIDLIPEAYSSFQDAGCSILHALKTGTILPMIHHLYKAAFKSKKINLLKISPDQIERIAHKLGGRISFFKENLTPSRYRYSCKLEF